MKKLILCAVLLLCTILFSFSSADALLRTSRWPAGVSLATFKDNLPETTDWFSGNPSDLKWYEGKQFFIDTENTGYGGVEILRIITISANNVIIVFDYNGTITYLPFNRIRKIYEEKE